MLKVSSSRKRIYQWNVVLKSESMYKQKGFTLITTLFMEAYIWDFVRNEARIKYKKDKLTFSVLWQLK